MPLHYIYKITNKLNSKIYIGRSKNALKRFKEHISLSKRPKDKKFSSIHRALNKYGQDNFIFEIIEVIDVGIHSNFELAKSREIYWISFFKTQIKKFGYNLTAGGDGALNISEESKQKRRRKMLGRKYSEEHRLKISIGNTGKTLSQSVKDKISIKNSGKNNGMFERIISDESRKKMSFFQSKRIRKPLSEEHKQKIRNAKQKQDMSFRISIEIKNEIINLYNSRLYTKKQLVTKFNLKFNTIVKIIRSHKIT